jgi:hypothetical protein
MALKLVNQAGNALGQFDGEDSVSTGALTLKGGEVVTFKSVVATSATDLAAHDVFDGYVSPNKRVLVSKNVADTSRPLMLADDGIAGYGTLFGSVVGGTVGQVVTGGAVLGPHTATGSGKVTCWHLPGVYAVSLDATDTDSAGGLQPTNTSLATGAPVYFTSAGLLTPTVSRSALGSGSPTIVGRFIDFETNGSLVTTPSSLVGALNPPDGAFSAAARTFAFATFYFNPPVA